MPIINRKDWYVADKGKQTFAGYENETLFNQGEELFEGKLREYPNASNIIVIRSYENNIEDRELNTRVIIQAVGGYNNINRKRKILARKKFGLRVGDIIVYEDSNWLVDDWVNQERTTDDFSSLQYCNDILQVETINSISTGEYDDFGRPKNSVTKEIVNLPCVYRTNKISSFDESPINIPDNRAHAYIQYNKDIKVGDEVYVGGKDYRVYGIDNTFKHPTEEYGFLILTLEMPGKTM